MLLGSGLDRVVFFGLAPPRPTNCDGAVWSNKFKNGNGLFGYQNWQSDLKWIKWFSTAWRMAIWMLCCLPYKTRSYIMPYLASELSLEEQVFSRIAKMYYDICEGFNRKMLLLLQMRFVLKRWGSWVSISELSVLNGVVVLNICNATIHRSPRGRR